MDQSIWRRHIEAQKSSGMSVREYCDRHGLVRQQFYNRRGRLQVREPSLFVPVTIKESSGERGLSFSLTLLPDGGFDFRGRLTDLGVLGKLFDLRGRP